MFLGWETQEAAPSAREAVGEGCCYPFDGIREDGTHMKNTGKRIFVAVAFTLLASLPLLVSAASTYSQR